LFSAGAIILLQLVLLWLLHDTASITDNFFFICNEILNYTANFTALLIALNCFMLGMNGSKL